MHIDAIKKLTILTWEIYTNVTFPLEIEICECPKLGFIEFYMDNENYIPCGFGYDLKLLNESDKEIKITICHELAHLYCRHDKHNDKFILEMNKIGKVYDVAFNKRKLLNI